MRPAQNWVQNLLFSRYAVEVYRLGDLSKSGHSWAVTIYIHQVTVLVWARR